MLGAIAGDVIGSVYEHRPVKSVDFPLFGAHSRPTDDTVLTVAVAHAVLDGADYSDMIRRYARAYPNAGYGGSFRRWMLSDDAAPYGSWGNGSAMRVSPVGLAFGPEEVVLAEAAKSAAVTHDHPEGIKGAQAVALAVYLAREGAGKQEIRREVESGFGYDLGRRLEEVRERYEFDVSCQGSVPESLIAFLESEDYEGAVRNAVSLGGDADTMAAIAGAVAHAFYREIPERIVGEVRRRLPDELVAVVERFERTYLP